MKVQEGNPIEYSWAVEGVGTVNSLIGKSLVLSHTGKFVCSVCKEEMRKLFGQGFCYPCFAKAPENSECIIKPELCKGHLGEGRDPRWEQDHHVQPHIVYLALTSAVKVGVTRKSNLVNRWIDQGAWKAIALAEVPNRFLAGQLEVFLKAHLTDKTNWRKMLTDQRLEIDLAAEKMRMISLLPDDFKSYVVIGDSVKELKYPVDQYPLKVSSGNFDKNPIQGGVLEGIRGQYLFFKGGKVLNIRKFTGYEVELEYKEASTEAMQQMTLF